MTTFQFKNREIFKPLKLPAILHQYLSNGFKSLPSFSGKEKEISAKSHILEFEYFLDKFQINYEDVALRMFCHSLGQDAQQWFQCLEANSINSWQDLQDVFLTYWGENKSYEEHLLELYSIRRQSNESISEFNRRFQKIYFSMPEQIRPPEAADMVYYLKAHSIVVAFYLKKRKPNTLNQMFLYAQEIEDNVWACRNFSCDVKSPSFVKDKRACEGNIGIYLQENVRSEANTDFQKVLKDSRVIERQESNHFEDSSQNLVATAELHYESMEDHCNNFVSSEENSAVS